MEVLVLVLGLGADLAQAQEVVRRVAEPYVAGEIRSFTCPPANDTEFRCDGLLVDGGTFHVWAKRAPDSALEVGPVEYSADRPSSFFTDVRDYGRPNSPLQLVRCHISGSATPDLFSCDAIFADGTTEVLNVGRRRGGSIRIYGIVIGSGGPIPSAGPAPRSTPFAIGAGIVIMASALLLTIGLVKILHTRTRLVVATLPLVAEQNIRFQEAGAYVLHGESPLFSTLFLGLKYALADAVTGREVSSVPAILRAHSSGFSRGRIALRRFFLEREGEYVLRIAGLRPDRDASAGAVVFSRSWPPLAYLWIVLTIGGSIGLFLGLFAAIAAMG